mmetsp:Transcript_30964/g.68597  ORF Transcript_30964/g.68597 Transcript_30964/m.68597 type:complete len:668 (+) Transcript_30964:195-2198(+)|eukprot:CAMPEP_0202902980 /NCGR_PEP_ID=MMETSP1392-20130828/20137_1 /ASSEMBLY_ACC=CAM_ASM_000868 /TAXON_ID=225041 /ORGANISM="Chlamydomonas chlamydogama, Strain SAG 11-48b" /LENGTH=667 /DNA_ID=CAMNT_0049589913 /DNA_START=151 /DNA_END=2154 /DNA_ORIENTATION=+
MLARLASYGSLQRGLRQTHSCAPAQLPRPDVRAPVIVGRGCIRSPLLNIKCQVVATQLDGLDDPDRQLSPFSLTHGGIHTIAELASAWSQVAQRLPETAEEEGQQQYEVLIIAALKLSLAWLQAAPLRKDGRTATARAVQLAATLADLCAAGLPLDAEAIAAGIVLEAVDHGSLDHDTIMQRVSPGVASLVHDVLRVRTAPERVELYDDVASSAIREWCLAFHDVRANVVEVISRWDELQHMSTLPYYEQQIIALEALQVYAPLGHALGIGAISARIEDLCFKVLFPESYTQTSEWLRGMIDEAEDALFLCQQQLLDILEHDEEFKKLASHCVIRARTKSLFSIMKKLLRVGDMSSGGRQREEIYDLLGMRAIVQPRQDLPPEQAEELARKACLMLLDVAHRLWTPVCGRTKDYISKPKANGYQSIHTTVCIPRNADAISAGPGQSSPVPCMQASVVSMSSSSLSSLDMPPGTQAPFLELQIRTQAMDEQAEAGEASHAAYKGGLDARQARQLQAWTRQLQRKLALRPQGKLMLPPSVTAQTTPTRQSLDASTLAVACYNGANAAETKVTGVARALFSDWDSDGNGVVSLEELREQLQQLGDYRAEAAEEVMELLSGGKAPGAAVPPAGQAETGITLPDFARFFKKASLINALDRLDRQQAQDLRLN